MGNGKRDQRGALRLALAWGAALTMLLALMGSAGAGLAQGRPARRRPGGVTEVAAPDGSGAAPLPMLPEPHASVSRGAAAASIASAPGLDTYADAPPQLPCAFWGEALAGGLHVPEGVRITAWVNGAPVATGAVAPYEGSSVYTLDILAATANAPGGEEGDTILFQVGALWAQASATWQSGAVSEHPLAVPAFSTAFGPAEVWSDLGALRKPSQTAYPRFIADVDGDGLGDAVLFHATKGIKVALSQGDAFGSPTWWNHDVCYIRSDQNRFPRFLADVNGDGMADVVLFHPTKGIKVSLSKGTSFGAPSWWLRVPSFSRQDDNRFPRRLADVNGDGMADAVIFHATKGVKVALSDGQGFQRPVWWSRDAAFMRDSNDDYPRALADVNGDGMADAVLFHREKGIKVALSTGHEFGAPTWWSADAAFTGATQNERPRLLADVDADGRADAVVYHEDGVYVALARDGRFAAPQRWHDGFAWSSQDAAPRTLGDVNGDGRADAVGFKANTGAIVGPSIAN